MSQPPALDLLGPSRPLISVIVPVRDDPEGLQACLAALAVQSLTPGIFEAIVVDNGSRLDPESVVEPFTFARITYEMSGGSYAARNTGVKQSQAPLLAFTDADCRPHPDWLAEGIAALIQDHELGIVGGRVEVYPRDGSRPTAAELYELHHAFPQRDYIERVGFAVTANAFTRRAAFDAVGGFDGELLSSGDRDFGRRVSAAGYAIVYVPRARVAHPARRTLGELFDKIERVTRGARKLELRAPTPPHGAVWPLLRRAIPPVRTCLQATGSPRIDGPATWLRYCTAVMLVRYAWFVLPLRHLLHTRQRHRLRSGALPSSKTCAASGDSLA